MPIYDYGCVTCQHVVEVIHRIEEFGPRFCPACGAEGAMRKGFTTPAVHFKGSGWAKKDRSTSSSPSKSGASKPTADATSTDAGGGASDSGGGASDPATTTAKVTPTTSVSEGTA